MDDEKKVPFITANAKSSKTRPIDPTSEDLFYRYKTRQLLIQVIGRGKMIKTAFLNIDEVAKDVKVQPEYILNWLSQQVGAKAWYDAKLPDRQRGSISGDHDLPSLNECYETFLHKFVLCKQCRLPEYTYVPLKKGDVGIKCRACAWKGLLSALDLPQKFHKYVVNHPPPKATGEGEDNRRAQAAKEKKREEKRMMRAAEKISAVPDGSIVDEDDWATDTSAAAAAARAAALVGESEALKDLVVVDESKASKSGAPKVAKAAKQLAGMLEAEEDSVAEPKGVLSVVQGPLAEKYNLGRESDALLVATLAGLVLASHGSKMGGVIKRNKGILGILVRAAPGGQRAALEAVHLAAEAMPEEDKPVLVKKLPVLLKGLYDADVVEEDTFLAWAEDPTSPQELVDAADKFITWLQEADEESEE